MKRGTPIGLSLAASLAFSALGQQVIVPTVYVHQWDRVVTSDITPNLLPMVYLDCYGYIDSADVFPRNYLQSDKTVDPRRAAQVAARFIIARLTTYSPDHDTLPTAGDPDDSVGFDLV